MRKESLPIIVGITLPILLVAAIAAAIYIPAAFVEPPKTDVLFVERNYQYGVGHYEVHGNALAFVPETPPVNDPYWQKPAYGPQLFRYDAEAHTMSPVTEEEAKKLKLDPSPVSPDGFMVDRGGGNGGIFPLFFFNDGDYGLFLRKGAYADEIPLPSMDVWSYEFLGWVIE
jgi:hypothetical protein